MHLSLNKFTASEIECAGVCGNLKQLNRPIARHFGIYRGPEGTALTWIILNVLKVPVQLFNGGHTDTGKQAEEYRKGW